jgi:hypothetical protein
MSLGALHVQPDAGPEPIQGVGHSRRPGTIAVVSDGSALTHRGLAGGAESVEPVLRHWAALIHAYTGLAVRPAYMAAQNAEDLTAGLRGLPRDIGTVFLIYTTRPTTRRPPGRNSTGAASAAWSPIRR